MKKNRIALLLAAFLAAGTVLPVLAGPASELKGNTAETQTTGSQASGTSAQGSSGTQASQKQEHRKTAEELEAVMATVPAGPAKAEWGTFFLAANQPPRNDEDESFLRGYHAYAMVPTQEKYVFLTFDEGYENGYTPAILDVLKKHGIKACFFCTGSFIRDNPELIKRFHEEGHIIGNHTLTHPSMMKVATWQEFSRQLLTVEENVKAITGVDMPRYYRPPSGGYSEAQLRMADAMGFKTIFWSVAYKDWDTSAQPSQSYAMNYLTTRIHPGAIILLHAVSSTNTAIMDQLLTTWEQMGYSFRTLDELPEGLTE
ncbi:MAG: polysaccharide deacetylase family protein [Clostridium sp.]|nr:polysaccharide deacetylase family protein [Clostridium sp.]